MSNAMDAETLVIDPASMNVVNRVAPGSRCIGNNSYAGGLLVQGFIEGHIEVADGPLVLMPDGVIAGTIMVSGDAYLFGTVNEKDSGELSEVTVQGVVYLAETAAAKSNITAAAFKTFEGAQVEGRIKTVGRSAAA